MPLVLADEGLRAAIGWLFGWKTLVLAAIIVLSLFLSRPFCKYLCPLGAIYSFFNGASFYHMRLDAQKCTNCGACSRKCPMDIDVVHDIDGPECIRCGECKRVCPHGAIDSGFAGAKIEKETKEHA